MASRLTTCRGSAAKFAGALRPTARSTPKPDIKTMDTDDIDNREALH
jgi:hypothetical protein